MRTNKRLVSWNDFEHQRVLGLTGTVNSSLWHTTGLFQSLPVMCYQYFIRGEQNKRTRLAIQINLKFKTGITKFDDISKFHKYTTKYTFDKLIGGYF